MRNEPRMNADGETKGRQENSRWRMHTQRGKDGTMDLNTPYRCSAQPDPPNNAAVTTYVYDDYGKRTCYEFPSTRCSGLDHHPLLEPARVLGHALSTGIDRG